MGGGVLGPAPLPSASQGLDPARSWSIPLGGDVLPTGAYFARLKQQAGHYAVDAESDEGELSGPLPPPLPRHQHTASSSSFTSIDESMGDEEREEEEAHSTPGSDVARWEYLEVTADGGVAVQMRLRADAAPLLGGLAKAASSPAELALSQLGLGGHGPASSGGPGRVPAAAAGAPPHAADIVPLNILMLVGGAAGACGQARAELCCARDGVMWCGGGAKGRNRQSSCG